MTSDGDRETRSASSFPERLQPTVFPAASTPPRRAARRPRVTAATIALVATLVAAVAVAVVLISQTWTGPRATPLAQALLRVDLVGGILPVTVYVVAGAALVAVAARRVSWRAAVSGAIGAVSGALLAAGLVWYLSAGNAFGVGLDLPTTIWSIAVFAAIGFALSTLWRSVPWRRLLAVVAILSFAAAGYLGINADFGLDRTVADVAGVSLQPELTLPVASATPSRPSPTPTLLAGGALWANWHPPVGMPTAGTQGQVVIPNTVSGFVARPAGLYLPPAAHTANPPALPLVIMMMGQPGNPDPSFSGAVLDRFAAQHGGLAPIVVVADQIGNPSVDPLCLDTARHGNAETYITRDVVDWARTHLHVLQDPAHWTVAGYSNGGECALSFGVRHPDIWGNVLDISGEEYPGSDRAAATLTSDFGGNRAAYEAAQPLNQLAGKVFPDTHAIFTVGSNDGSYVAQAKRVVAATAGAGWRTTYFEVPNGGHVLGALNGGLQEGYSVLYPVLGLSAP